MAIVFSPSFDILSDTSHINKKSARQTGCSENWNLISVPLEDVMRKEFLTFFGYCMVAAACGFMASYIAMSQEVPVPPTDSPVISPGQVIAMQKGCPNLSPSLPSGYILKFERLGGYFGVCDSFWIYPDGRVINHFGKTAKIPSETVNEWAKSIPPLNPSGAVEVKIFTAACEDCFEYRVTLIEKDGSSRTLGSFDQGQMDAKTAAKFFSGIRDRLIRLKWD